MTILVDKYFNTYLKIRYFLSSCRALSDGKSGIENIEQHLKNNRLYLWQWKILWIGTCTVLRSSIDLFQVDSKSCINERIRNEINNEWIDIKKNSEKHSIYWNFLKKERDNIIHEYKWNAYEVWLDESGDKVLPPPTLLSVPPENSKVVLAMKDGPYKGRDSLDLLLESAAWAEDRMLSAIRRAGFDPDEERNMRTFRKRPPLAPGLLSESNTLLGDFEGRQTEIRDSEDGSDAC